MKSGDDHGEEKEEVDCGKNGQQLVDEVLSGISGNSCASKLVLL